MRDNIFRQLSMFLICGLISLAVLAPAAQAKRKKAAARAKIINGSGCVTEGVEAGCLVLTDSKTQKVYNLYFRGRKKPRAGAAIRFSGTEHTGPTICMQGQAVKVRTWITLKKKCPRKTDQ